MQISLVCVMMNTSHIKTLSNKKKSRHHERKKRDNKGRILHTGESQRTDEKYLYKYVDAFGTTKYVCALILLQLPQIHHMLHNKRNNGNPKPACHSHQNWFSASFDELHYICIKTNGSHRHDNKKLGKFF